MKRILFLLILVLFMRTEAALASPYKVLVIHSYHPELPWVQQCNKGIQWAFGKDFTLQFEYLDTKRIPEPQFASAAAAAMQDYTAYAPDIVLLGDDNALRLLGPSIAKNGTLVVFFGINGNPRNYFDQIPHNVTGVLETLPLFSWIRYLQKIMPNASKNLMLMDNSPTAKALIDSFFNTRKRVSIGKITSEFKSVSSWDEWKNTVLQLTGYDYVTIPVFHNLKDASGKVVPVETVRAWTSANCKLPVFAYQDYMVGDDGVIGAYVITGETHAFRAASIAKRLLRGDTKEGVHSQMDDDGKFFFNKKQLSRFGLVLPPDMEKRTTFK